MLKTPISGTNTSCRRLRHSLHGASFINDCLLQPMLHVNHPLLQFIDIADSLLSTAALLYCFPDFIVIGCRLKLLRRPYILQDEF